MERLIELTSAAPPTTLADEEAVATDAAAADPTEEVAEATTDEVTAKPTDAATAADMPCLPADCCDERTS